MGCRNSYYRWKRKRAARKFEVYMRKHDRGDYATKTTSTRTVRCAILRRAIGKRKTATRGRRG